MNLIGRFLWLVHRLVFSPWAVTIHAVKCHSVRLKIGIFMVVRVSKSVFASHNRYFHGRMETTQRLKMSFQAFLGTSQKKD